MYGPISHLVCVHNCISSSLVIIYIRIVGTFYTRRPSAGWSITMGMAKHVSDIKMLSNQSSKISQTLLTDLSLALRMPHVLILYVPSFLHMQIALMNSGHHSSLTLGAHAQRGLR